MARTVVGLEITEESVRAAELTVGRAPVLVSAGEVGLPPGAAKDSEVLDRDAVAVALRQLWTRAGIEGRRVVLGIGSRRVLVREYTTQAMRPDLLRQALPYQVQDLLPVPVSQAVLDFYPLVQTGDQIAGLLVAAVAETVEDLLSTLGKAKLAADAVDLVPFGLARIARRLGGAGETVAMIHLGDHTSYVVVAVDGIPRFVRIIPVDIPTPAVQARVSEQASPEVALVGDPPLSPPRGRPALYGATAADSAVADVVSRLRGTLAFYGNRPGAAPVTTVLLSGAGSAVDGIRSALSHALAAHVRQISPRDVLRAKDAAAADSLPLNLVSTIGIALEEGY